MRNDNLKDLMQQRRARADQQTGLRRAQAQVQARETARVSLAEWIPVEMIIEHADVQVRVEGVDPERVSQYALAMEQGAEFPAIIVFRADDVLYVADGFHRLAAARQWGQDQILALIRPGGLDAAIEFAEEANLQHGLSLSTKDKRGIFERRYKRNHQWFHRRGGLSNRQIAGILGVDEKTIRNWLDALSASLPETKQGRNAENSAPKPQKVRTPADHSAQPGYTEDDWLNEATGYLDHAAAILADLGYAEHADHIRQIAEQIARV